MANASKKDVLSYQYVIATRQSKITAYTTSFQNLGRQVGQHYYILEECDFTFLDLNWDLNWDNTLCTVHLKKHVLISLYLQFLFCNKHCRFVARYEICVPFPYICGGYWPGVAWY
ncbi:hypothetical protein XELAEV_18029421mg [Xenopus laevis]|uniref:Uncharacterized protein n=1 Tax=Xenopus laevis TaxID=8355 RepID=A0A974CT64_XENLA|nr:hypothetical protein XELAEV_18029421mg [Xenopus laevis]